MTGNEVDLVTPPGSDLRPQPTSDSRPLRERVWAAHARGLSERAIARDLGITRHAVRRLLYEREPLFAPGGGLFDALELLFGAPHGRYPKDDEDAVEAGALCLDLAARVDAGAAPAMVADDVERVAVALVEGWTPAENPLIGILLRRSLRLLDAALPPWLVADAASALTWSRE